MSGTESGERRIVTVLFADVSGFTALSEKLDPEDVREIMNRAFGALSEVIYRHGWVVDKYIGDAVMALFGVPRAREDDAARAVRAGLAMQEALTRFAAELHAQRGFSLAMRVGINTGRVVAGEVGSKQKSEFTVMGDAVNLASRIEHAAAVGKVWVSAETHRFVRGRGRGIFEFKKLRPMAIKGKQGKLQFFEVIAARSESSPADDGALKSAFLGRDKELAVLEEALRVARGGECVVVSLVGEAGTGKSALLGRFAASVRAQEERGEVHLLEAACPAECAAYGLFLPLTRGCGEAGFPAEDDPQWKDKFFLASERWFMNEAGRAPVVLTLEDLHFADPGSWELLGFMINRFRRLPLLIVCAFRPGVERNLYWPSAENYVNVSLKPFDLKTGSKLVDKCLGRNRLPAAFKEGLVRKAAGNPYFLTELVWSLAECGRLERRGGAWSLAAGAGRGELPVPDTVQATLQARLDSLPDEARRLLHSASVLGFWFTVDIAAELVAAGGSAAPADLLEELVDRRFLSKALRPGRSEAAFEFTHGLLQEVCYDNLLRGDRTRLHLSAARALERRHPAPSPETLQRIADHYFRSAERSRALELCFEVARRAGSRFAAATALGYYRRCLELLEEGLSAPGVDKPSLLLEMGRLCVVYNDLDQAVSYLEASVAVEGCGGEAGVEACRALARIRTVQGHTEKAAEILSRAAETERCLSPRQRALLHYELASFLFGRGEEARAREWVSRLAEEVRGLGVEVPAGGDLHELLPVFSFLTETPEEAEGRAAPEEGVAA